MVGVVPYSVFYSLTMRVVSDLNKERDVCAKLLLVTFVEQLVSSKKLVLQLCRQQGFY